MPTDTQTNDITGLTYTSPFLLNTYSNGINYNPNNQNSAKPNGEITYQLGGNMLLRVDNRTFISSKTILGKRGVFNTYYVDSSLNEKMIIYVDPSYNKSYIYPYYEKDGNYTTNNALTLRCDQDIPGSNVGLNLVSGGTGNGISVGTGMVIEAITTFLLMTVIYGVAVDSRGTFKSVAGFPIGLMITLDILATGPATGGVMNPARWFGPAIAGMNFSNAIIWIIGPLLGAAIAAIAYERIAKP